MRWFLLALLCILAIAVALRAGQPGWLGAEKDPARNVLQVIVWAFAIVTGVLSIGGTL